jgi:hypothetical protein
MATKETTTGTSEFQHIPANTNLDFDELLATAKRQSPSEMGPVEKLLDLDEGEGYFHGHGAIGEKPTDDDGKIKVRTLRQITTSANKKADATGKKQPFITLFLEKGNKHATKGAGWYTFRKAA